MTKLFVPLLWLGLAVAFSAVLVNRQALVQPLTAPSADLMGQPLYTESDERIGKVASVVVNIETGAVDYLILARDHATLPSHSIPYDASASGGYIAIPWAAIQHERTDGTLILHVSTNRLDHAPRFTQLPNTNVAGWDAEVRAYWNEKE